MNLNWIDWSILFATIAFFAYSAYRAGKYTKSSVDFLAANRCAGRYMLTMAQGMSGMGAATLIGMFQMYYRAGFAAGWWSNLAIPISLLVGISGWVLYRYRETRSLTLPQFLEMRYGRNFRVFAGCLCWFSGILNFGIFPAIGANFFLYFCGLAESYHVSGFGLNFSIPTYPMLVIALVGVSLYYVFAGGQIAVLVTDFLQSVFTNIFSVALLIFVLIKFPLSDVFDGLMIAPEGKSMLNPFHAGKIEGFNHWYYLINVFNMTFNLMAWQGQQGSYVSAKSPHELKMASVLGTFRKWGMIASFTLVPLVAYMIMHHPDYAPLASQVTESLNLIENEQVRSQMITPMTMKFYLPVGFMGLFAAVMFATLVTTHDSYMHSWGSMFVQDVFMPFRKKPLDNKKHMKILKLSIAGVAIYACLFSIFFKQTQDIFMYFAITGAVWLGGAGIVIIGGLYTSWGKTRGAVAALITGSILATAGMIAIQILKTYYDEDLILFGFNFSGQVIFFWAMIASIIMYILFSSIGKRAHFNLDKMLHRGKYRVVSDHATEDAVLSTHKRSWKQIFGITKEFTRGDKIIYGLTIGKSLFFLSLFVGMTFYALVFDNSDRTWRVFFEYQLWFYIIMSFIIAVWLMIGGIRDLISMIRHLKVAKRDYTDDGTVRDHDFEEDITQTD